MPLPLIYYGNKILRTKCMPVKEITEEIKKLVADMIESMDAYNGIGIAAPQLGHLLRIFVLRNYINHPDGSTTLSEPSVYINPKLSEPSLKKVKGEEGCISIPNIRGEVERPWKIKVEAMDLNGNIFTEEVEDYNARVRMHENDHLNGVLYIDRMTPRHRKKINSLLEELEKKGKAQESSH